MKDKIGYEGGNSSVRKILLDLGFKWKRTDDNRKLLIEKSDVREKRIYYLTQIKNTEKKIERLFMLTRPTFYQRM